MSSAVYIKNNSLIVTDNNTQAILTDISSGVNNLIGSISNSLAHPFVNDVLCSGALTANTRITPLQPQLVGHIVNIWGGCDTACTMTILYSGDKIVWFNTGKKIVCDGTTDVFLEIPYCAAKYVSLISDTNINSILLFYGVSR